MSKFFKVSYSLLGLLLLTILGLNVWFASQRITLPPGFEWLNFHISLPDFWQNITYQYIFWVALVFFIIVLVKILIKIFTPRTYTEFKLDENKGTLLLKKSAIDGFVKSLITTQEFMNNPVVKTKLYKKKFAVEVKGEARRQSDILQKTKDLQRQLEEELKTTFGLTQSVDFKVLVKTVENSKNKDSKKRLRVE